MIGRVLLEDGSPAVGARIELVTQVSLPDGNGKKTRWSGTGKSDSSGAFSMAFVPGLDFESKLTASLPGYLALEWTWNEVPAEGVKTLPDRRFDNGLYVTGSIVDGEGNLLTEGWRVSVKSRGIDNARSVGRIRFAPDRATGHFRIGPLTPGEIELQGIDKHGLKTETLVVQVGAGEAAHVLLRQAGKSAFRSIFVKALPAQISGLGLKGPFSGGLGASDRTFLFLLDRDGSVLAEALWLLPKTSGTWWFADVAPAEYSLELRHPLFEPVRVDGLSPGRTEQIQLVGSAALEVRVLDPGGNPVPDYKAEVRYVDGRRNQAYPLLSSGLTQAGAERFPGIVPGELRLFVGTPGGQRIGVDLGLVIAGETRRVDVRIAPSQPLVVEVIDHKGRAVEGIELSYLSTAGDNRSLGVGVARTGSGGRHAIEDAFAGPWIVEVPSAPYGKARQNVEHPQPGGGPVVLQLSALGSVRGRLRSYEGFDFSSVELWVVLDDHMNSLRWRQEHGEELKVDSDGRFLLTGLPIGGAQFALFHDGLPRSAGMAGNGVFLRETEIVEGDQDWELDLAPLLRASCEVSLDGKAQIGLRVALLNEGMMNAITSAAFPVQPPSRMVPLDEDGRALVRDLKPRTLHTVVAVDPVDKWAVPIGEVRTKAYGDDVRIECSLQLVEREVLVRNAKGKPLPHVEFGWSCQGLAPTGARAEADAEGKFMLRMPPGMYSLFRTGQDRPTLASFVWEAGNGPLVIDLASKR